MADREALAGLLRAGNAGSNTPADHITVLEMAIAALPEHARPVFDPATGTWTGPRLLARSDSAGATHAFAAACVDRGLDLSFGFPVDARIQTIVDLIPEQCWQPAIQTDGEFRDGAWVAEATDLIDLGSWPEGSRLILRKERPHPGAQLSFTDVDGHRITAILTTTTPGIVPGPTAGLETAAPSARPSRGPDPGGQGHRAAQPSLPSLERERRLARDRPHRGRPPLLDQTDLFRRRSRARPLRDRSVPLPGPAHCRPHHPQRPASTATHRQDLALGNPLPRASNDYASRSPDHPRPARTGPWDQCGIGRGARSPPLPGSARRGCVVRN